jgi:hypothetical protein
MRRLSHTLLSLSRIHSSPSLAYTPLPLSRRVRPATRQPAGRRRAGRRRPTGERRRGRHAPPPSLSAPARLPEGRRAPRATGGTRSGSVYLCSHGGYTRGVHTGGTHGGHTRGTHGGYTLPVPRATASSSQRRGGGCPGVGSEGRRLARPSGPTSAPRRMLGPTRLRPAGLAAAAVPKRPGYSVYLRGEAPGPRWRGRGSLEGQGLAGGAGARWRGRASLEGQGLAGGAGPRWRGRASLEGQGLAGGAGARWRGRASLEGQGLAGGAGAQWL